MTPRGEPGATHGKTRADTEQQLFRVRGGEQESYPEALATVLSSIELIHPGNSGSSSGPGRRLHLRTARNASAPPTTIRTAATTGEGPAEDLSTTSDVAANRPTTSVTPASRPARNAGPAPLLGETNSSTTARMGNGLSAIPTARGSVSPRTSSTRAHCRRGQYQRHVMP